MLPASNDAKLPSACSLGLASRCLAGMSEPDTYRIRVRSFVPLPHQLPGVDCDYLSWLSHDANGLRGWRSDPAPEARKSVAQLREFRFRDASDYGIARRDHRCRARGLRIDQRHLAQVFSSHASLDQFAVNQHGKFAAQNQEEVAFRSALLDQHSARGYRFQAHVPCEFDCQILVAYEALQYKSVGEPRLSLGSIKFAQQRLVVRLHVPGIERQTCQ
jgi:hypothetical protein